MSTSPPPHDPCFQYQPSYFVLAAMTKQPSIPKTGTVAARDFYNSWKDINRLFDFVLKLVGKSEYVAKTAHEALFATESDDAKKAEMLEQWNSRKGPLDELKENRQLLLETILVRHVENYINYISSVLFEIFIARPETLKSSDKVEVSKILEHDSIDSLVREIALMKVDSLSYSSFSKLADFFNERFKIPLATPEEIALIHEFIEIRNISVHNRCFINSRFISRMGIDSSYLGKKKDLYGQDIDKLTPLLIEAVKVTDISIRRKLKVKGVRFADG
jgi:hypothetical protein